MNLWSTTFFIVATTISEVQSRCFSLNPTRVDFDHLCAKWWLKAYRHSRYSDSRTKCIYLIKEKCPNMLKLKTPIRRRFDGSYETWITEGQAFGDGYTTLDFFDYKKRPVCTNDKGKSIDCGYWWSVLKEKTAENKYKEICLDHIMKYCKDMITDVQETKAEVVQRYRASYDVKTVTYTNRDGDKASLNRYVPVKRKPNNKRS